MKLHIIVPMLAVAVASATIMAKEKVEEVIVTATRTTQSIADTLAPVTLITAADIERLQPVDMYDVLDRVPGINMRRSGGMGTTTSLFLRGASTGQTLVLVDGVRISSATSGTAALEHLDPEQIERIEVVRGSHSSLYGADAIGGVIQIFTKRGAEGFHPEVKISIGTNALQEQQLSLAGGNDKVRYRISGNHLQTDGFDRQNDGDDDAYRKTAASAFLSWSISDQLSTEFAYQLSRGESEFDGFDGTDFPFTKFRLESLSNKTVFDATKNLKFTSIIARSTDLSDSRNDIPGLGFGAIKTRRDSYGLQSDYQWGENQLFTFGAEIYNDRVSGDNAYAGDSRKNRAFYGQYQLTLGQFDLLAGWRRDDNEIFETANTRNLSLGYAVNSNIKAIYSYSTGFRAPTFNDLYFPNFGNPNLNPEYSKSREFTLKGDWDLLNVELSFFRTKYKDLIQNAVSPGSPFGVLPFNVGDARVEGFDLVVGTELAGYAINGSYTWIDPDDTSGVKDTLLNRRSRRLLKLDVDKRFGQFSAGVSLSAQGKFEDSGKKMPGFGTLDLRLGYNVNESLSFRLKVSNALDKDYQTINSYDEDGVNAVFSASYRL